MTARRATVDDAPWVLALIQRAFAAHDGRIDPPSSMHRMSVADVETQIAEHEVWGIGQAACLFATPQDDALYLSKLAVHPEKRGRGYARLLLDHAAKRARAQGKSCLRLQTRIELVENHAAFRALGFNQVGTTRHPGHDRTTSLIFEKTLID
ncbi:GNAT family N-acetyltransferase [Aliiroseovarius crassostreae]|uniref:GNAT family N-acetyltransferase n=1 Tax=Aliiroseovarius crassostreae TaxID=154981 RepID=UPI003C7BAA08